MDLFRAAWVEEIRGLGGKLMKIAAEIENGTGSVKKKKVEAKRVAIPKALGPGPIIAEFRRRRKHMTRTQIWERVGKPNEWSQKETSLVVDGLLDRKVLGSYGTNGQMMLRLLPKSKDTHRPPTVSAGIVESTLGVLSQDAQKEWRPIEISERTGLRPEQVHRALNILIEGRKIRKIGHRYKRNL